MDVVPECYVDTNIVCTLLDCKRVNHQHGCGRVKQTLKKQKDRFAVGIVDNDKHSIYKENYKEIAHSDSLTLMKDDKELHYLLLIGKKGKAAEVFLFSCAKEKKINMSDFHLPEDLKELMKETKRVEASNDSRITKLVKSLMIGSEMERLKQVIEYLLKENYNADKETLTRLLTSDKA